MKWKKTFIWKNISIICSLSDERSVDNNSTINNENNTLLKTEKKNRKLCLYRPDTSFQFICEVRILLLLLLLFITLIIIIIITSLD